MASESRPHTPDPVARKLRQLAGFGCCKCGVPVLQYHHIIPYSLEKHFRTKDMMALCPTCHDMVTKGAITLAQQRQYQANPYNISRGYTDGNLILNNSYCVIQTGGVQVVGQGPLISVDGHVLLALSLGPTNQVEISVNLYDKKDRVVAIIDKNEWVSGDVALWDIRADHQKLTINKKHGQIELEVNTQGDAINIKARLWYRRKHIRLSSMGLSFDHSPNEVKIKDLAFVNSRFEVDTQKQGVTIVPNDGGGLVIAEADPVLRLDKAIKAWAAKFAKNAHPTSDSV